MKKIHLLLAGQSLIIVLLSVNRLSTLTIGYVLPNQFLRWVDLNNMIVLPLASVALSYLLKWALERDAPGAPTRPLMLVSLVFVLGVYLLGAGYGAHEVTNYLHARFCLDDASSDLCQIVIYNDDEFSHYVFFLGYILLNAAVMIVQLLAPRDTPVSRGDLALVSLNALFIATGIFANLAFEEIGLDLYVVTLMAMLSLYLLWLRRDDVRRVPIVLYFAIAFVLSAAATAMLKAWA